MSGCMCTTLQVAIYTHVHTRLGAKKVVWIDAKTQASIHPEIWRGEDALISVFKAVLFIMTQMKRQTIYFKRLLKYAI